ncbi:DUF814 domain-containing protein [bacterium]|nr:DUF814 domain-containing protein [bacterium]
MNVLLLKAWLADEGPALIGARLKAARQYDPRSVALELAGEAGPVTLLISVLEEYPILAVLRGADGPPAPDEPESNFTKALNFHLAGHRLDTIEQSGFDRSVVFTFTQRDMYGQESLKRLRHELVGRASNAYLISDRQMVISIFKRVRREQNRVRRIITGKPLPDPPPLGKFIAAGTTVDALADELADLAGREGVEAEDSLAHFFARRVAGCDVKLWDKVEPLLPVSYDLESLWEFTHRLQRGDLTAELFGLTQRGDANRLALETWRKALKRRGLKPARTNVERERIAARIDLLREQLRQAGRADAVEQAALAMLREAGEIDDCGTSAAYIQAWQQAHPDWAEQVAPEKSAYDNAQELVHYAQRLRRGREKLNQLIAKAEAELEEIERRRPADHKKPADPLKTERKRLDRAGVKYQRFVSSDGLQILCGASDKSNDELLRIFGNGRHLWLHARDFPGSHVIILNAGQDVPPRTLEEAALIAGWHSRGQNEAELDVSYLPMKYLRRPKDGKPGQVLKMQEKVLNVRPQQFTAIRERLLDRKAEA